MEYDSHARYYIYLSLSSVQIFLGFWFIYAFLVTTYYKSAFMAVLAVPAIPSTINTLEELLKSGLDYGMIDAKVRMYRCSP